MVTAAGAGIGFAPFGAWMVGLCSDGTEGTVVACKVMWRGDCDGLTLAVAGQAAVFEDLLESDPDTVVLIYAIPVVVW